MQDLIMQDLSSYKVSPPQPVELEGARLRLVPFNRQEHGQALWACLGGADGINALLTYFPIEGFAHAEDFVAWLQDLNESTAASPIITEVFIEKATNQVVGMASFMRPDVKNGVIEVGYVAHGKAMSRSPLSTEAHYLMAAHVFEGLGYRRYEWKCHHENQPSRVTAARLGFEFEGIFRNHMISKGKNRNTCWFAMIDSDWPKIKAAFEAWLAPENFAPDGTQIARLEDLRNRL